jgi:DNA polymerase V
MSVAACKLMREDDARMKEPAAVQMDLFTDFGLAENTGKGTGESVDPAEKKRLLERDKALQKAELEIKRRFGKNAILKGTNFMEGSTAIERNAQIGGHKA